MQRRTRQSEAQPNRRPAAKVSPKVEFVTVDFERDVEALSSRRSGISKNDIRKIRSAAAKCRVREAPLRGRNNFSSVTDGDCMPWSNASSLLLSSSLSSLDPLAMLLDSTLSNDLAGTFGHSVSDYLGSSSLAAIEQSAAEEMLEWEPGHTISNNLSEQDFLEKEENTTVSKSAFKINPFTVAIAKSLADRIQSNRLDPFWSFSVPYRPWLSEAIHYTMNDLCPGIPGLDAPGENLMLEQFTRHMDNDGFMCAITLIGASSVRERQLMCRSPPGNVISAEDLAWLRCCAIRSINKGLANPSACRNIEVLLSGALTMANWEATFGDSALFELHMAGAARLLKLAGGLGALHSGIRRLWKWFIEQSDEYLSINLDSPYQRFQPRWTEWTSIVSDAAQPPGIHGSDDFVPFASEV